VQEGKLVPGLVLVSVNKETVEDKTRDQIVALIKVQLPLGAGSGSFEICFRWLTRDVRDFCYVSDVFTEFNASDEHSVLAD
jgi:hypothetical protein